MTVSELDRSYGHEARRLLACGVEQGCGELRAPIAKSTLSTTSK